MGKVIGVITARMTSSRFPGKVLRNVAGKSLFAHHFERMSIIKGLDGIFLATANQQSNKELIEEAERLGCGWISGPEEDVVERHIKLCERESADAVVRVPCDSPLFDINSLSLFVEIFKNEYHDYIYVSNMIMDQGTVKEVISYDALCRVHKHYWGPAIAIYILENMKEFNTLGVDIDVNIAREEYRLTVDYPVDLDVIAQIYEALYKGGPISLREVYSWLDENPEVAVLNKDVHLRAMRSQNIASEY
jgi:spore coat polysaccharide biosynthesis protein SpsF